MLHFKLHTFIFICFPNLQRSIPNSSALAFFFLPTAKLQSVLNFFFSFDYFWRTISTCCMKIFIAPETASAAIKNDISIERARNDLVTFFTYPPFWVRASGENWFSVFFSPFFVCTQIFQKTIIKFFFCSCHLAGIDVALVLPFACQSLYIWAALIACFLQSYLICFLSFASGSHR